MKYKLQEVFEFIRNGANIKQGVEGGYPITRIETISERVVNKNKMGYAGIYDLTKYEDFLLNEGDILMSHINSEIHLGKTAIYEVVENEEKIIHGMNLICLRPKKDVLYPKYALYYFNTIHFKHKLNKIIKKSVNQASFSVTDLKKFEIELPVKEIQIKISNLLDKSKDLIDKRRAQIEALDQLTQSVFLEMFGDPVINPYNYECTSIDKLCSSIYGGGTPSKSKPQYYIDGKIPWVTPKDMKSILIDTSIDYITQEAVENSSAKLIPKNSLLMVIRSGILKRNLPVAINLEEVTVNQDMKAFIFNPNKVTTEYILYFFKFYQRILLSQVRSVTADNLDFKQIKQIPVPVPNLIEQKKFTDIFYRINKEKRNFISQLTEFENVFNSIMQRAFKGELFTQEKVPNV